jgi:hypothetical protein
MKPARIYLTAEQWHLERVRALAAARDPEGELSTEPQGFPIPPPLPATTPREYPSVLVCACALVAGVLLGLTLGPWWLQ